MNAKTATAKPMSKAHTKVYEKALVTALEAEAESAGKPVDKLSAAAVKRASATASAEADKIMAERAAAKPHKDTKRSVCAEVFCKMVDSRRKDVIDAMVEKADMTKAGAATYYQNFHSGKWDSTCAHAA